VVGSTMLDRSRGRGQTKDLILEIGGLALGKQPHLLKQHVLRNIKIDSGWKF
jgi:hypothetical protein